MMVAYSGVPAMKRYSLPVNAYGKGKAVPTGKPGVTGVTEAASIDKQGVEEDTAVTGPSYTL